MNEIYKRRSIRRYNEKDIPNDILKEILKAGMNAPSAYNSKPYEFIVIESKDLLLSLSEIKQEASFLKWSNKAIVLLAIEDKSLYWQQDLGASMQNMLLTATENNIGSCWIGCAPAEEVEAKVKDILGIPKKRRVFAILSLGYTDNEKEENNYFDENIIHYNKY